MNVNENLPVVRQVRRPFQGLPMPGNQCWANHIELSNLVQRLTSPGLAHAQKEELKNNARQILPLYLQCKERGNHFVDYNLEDLNALFGVHVGGKKSRKYRKARQPPRRRKTRRA